MRICKNRLRYSRERALQDLVTYVICHVLSNSGSGYEQPSPEPGTLLCNHLVAVMFCIKCYSRISISRDQQPITNCFSVILRPLQDDCWPTVIHIRILVWSFRICFLFGRWSHEIKFLIESSILIKQDPLHHSFLIKYDLSFWIIFRSFEIVLNHEPLKFEVELLSH